MQDVSIWMSLPVHMKWINVARWNAKQSCMCLCSSDRLPVLELFVAGERSFSEVQKHSSLSPSFFIAFSSNIQLCKCLGFLKCFCIMDMNLQKCSSRIYVSTCIAAYQSSLCDGNCHWQNVFLCAGMFLVCFKVSKTRQKHSLTDNKQRE